MRDKWHDMAQTMRHLAVLIDFVPLQWHDLARQIILRGIAATKLMPAWDVHHSPICHEQQISCFPNSTAIRRTNSGCSVLWLVVCETVCLAALETLPRYIHWKRGWKRPADVFTDSYFIIVFLPRNDIQRGHAVMRCLSGRPSVRPSVWLFVTFVRIFCQNE